MKDKVSQEHEDAFLKSFGRDVFIQTEIINLTHEVKEYPVILNSNYEYCYGVVVASSVGGGFYSVLGLKEKGVFVVDECLYFHYQRVHVTDFSDSYIPVSIIAKGTQKFVSVDKNGSGITSLKLFFLLSNVKRPFKKQKIGFSKIDFNTGFNTGRINFNESFKYIKGVNIVSAASGSVDAFSVSDSSRTFIDKLTVTDFIGLVGYFKITKRFIPVFIKSGNLEYEIEATAPGTLYFIYEYE